MKFLYFLIFVLLLASGYFAYQEGYLAGVHPLLDPKAKIVIQREGEDGDAATAESEGREENETGGTKKKEEPAKVVEVSEDKKDGESKVATGSAGSEISERERAKQERVERDRLAREARAAEREAADAALKAESEARAQHNARVDQEVTAFEEQSNDLQKLLRDAERKMLEQETVWRQEKIKTREVEKQELRDASAAYQDQIKVQIEQVRVLLREKRKEYK